MKSSLIIMTLKKIKEKIFKTICHPWSTKTLASEIMFIQIQLLIHRETNTMSKGFDLNIASKVHETYLLLCLQRSCDQTARSVARPWPSFSQVTASARITVLINNRNLTCHTSKFVHCMTRDISFNLKGARSC